MRGKTDIMFGSGHERVNTNKMAELVGTSAWYLQTFNPAKTLDPAYNNVSSYSKTELSDIISSLGLKNADVR